MLIPSQRRIRELHSQGENSRVDFKVEYHLRDASEKTELAKDVCALANVVYQNSGHGYLIIGIDNDGNLAGINPDDYRETRIQQTVSRRTSPPPTFNLHHVEYRNVDIAILVIRRNTGGPHQLWSRTPQCMGFPIRRGSTTDMMNTDEVYQAMRVRERSFTRQQSDYAIFDPNVRQVRLINDCEEALNEFSASQSVERIEYHGDGQRSRRPRVFLKLEKAFNSRRWNLYCSVQSQSAALGDLYAYDGSVSGVSEDIPLHRSIFIHLVHGTISSSFYSSRERYFSQNYIRVPIEPKITYFGLGEGVTEEWFLPYLSPKFFVSHIKSKEDIHMRLDLILGWISQNRKMFEGIRQAFQRPY